MLHNLVPSLYVDPEKVFLILQRTVLNARPFNSRSSWHLHACHDGGGVLLSLCNDLWAHVQAEAWQLELCRLTETFWGVFRGDQTQHDDG